ncbi:hypothetical protein [Streptomyces sp. NPDC050504]|uniref:hypothetical protein n=1 Tax=Streptomyces sp. NPDC050504 TaxID=3365618 RepID=UPI0037BD1BFB
MSGAGRQRRAVRGEWAPTRRAALVAVALALAAAGCGESEGSERSPETGRRVTSGPAGKLLETRDAAGHRLRQVDKAGAPEVRLTVQPDSEDGWNLQLAPKGFRFTPESIGGPARPGRGYAWLLIDDRPLARVYGPWFHLPGDAVAKGTHTLAVRLSADDHTVWAVSGKPVEGTAQLTASTGGEAARG